MSKRTGSFLEWKVPLVPPFLDDLFFTLEFRMGFSLCLLSPESDFTSIPRTRFFAFGEYGLKANEGLSIDAAAPILRFVYIRPLSFS